LRKHSGKEGIGEETYSPRGHGKRTIAYMARVTNVQRVIYRRGKTKGKVGRKGRDGNDLGIPTKCAGGGGGGGPELPRRIKCPRQKSAMPRACRYRNFDTHQSENSKKLNELGNIRGIHVKKSEDLRRGRGVKKGRSGSGGILGESKCSEKPDSPL